MNKPFKLLLLVSIGSVLSLLIGCSSSDEKKAKKMAVDYISEKYGFVPEISGVEFSQTGGGIVAKGIYATVFMKYNGTEFQVCVNYKDTDKPRTDNYEKDMFINDLKLFLKEHFSFDSMAVKIYCCNADFMVGTDIRSINDLFTKNQLLSIVVYTYGINRKNIESFDNSLLGDKNYIGIYQFSAEYPHF